MAEEAGRVGSALAEFSAAWSDGYLAAEGPWSAFTCTEIEALVGLLRALGPVEARAAEVILATHARGDDEGDAHYEAV